jgi:hypothetical protein
MSDPLHDVAIAASELKAVARRDFDAFLGTVQAWHERLKVDLESSPEADFRRAQGMSYAASMLRQKLERCTEIREQAIARRR